MRRIVLILVLAFMLLPSRPSPKDSPLTPANLLVTAQPLPLDSAQPGRTRVGRLNYLSGWSLTSNHKDFGGISALAIRPEGGLLALSDSGTLMGFNVQGGTSRQFIAPLPIQPAERDFPRWKWDSESMTHDPGTGRYWAGFELIHRICRYDGLFARVEACRTWPEMEAWPKTGGAEAIARLPDGRFMVFSEMGYAPAGGGNDVLLFGDDPTEPTTPPPAHLAYQPPQGYRPTDALMLCENKLLVLNRRVTLHEGFTAILVLITLNDLRPGTRLVGEELARLAPPLLSDNYEALALSYEGGGPILWIASDDNHEFFQRTLLLKFGLPADLQCQAQQD